MRRLGFCLAFPALFEVALACAAEPREPARVALREGRWFINDRATNAGRSAEGLLMNVRIVNATFEDHLRADFNAGVVGLAASRLVETFYRPAVVGQISDDTTRCSCRSIPEFHITQALDRCSELLEHHGGHAAAAGFTVHNDKLPDLIARLRSLAYEKLHSLDLRPTLSADAEIPLANLTIETLNILSLLEPTGQGNPLAHFVSRNLKVKGFRAVGRESTHLRMYVTDGQVTRQAIAFHQAHWVERMPMQVDLLYHPELNDYYGEPELQLHVYDLKPSGTPDL